MGSSRSNSGGERPSLDFVRAAAGFRLGRAPRPDRRWAGAGSAGTRGRPTLSISAAAIAGLAVIVSLLPTGGCVERGTVAPLRIAVERTDCIIPVLTDDLLPAFEAQTGLRVELVRVGTDSLPASLTAGSGRADGADLIIADGFVLAALVHAGLVGSPEDHAGLIAEEMLKSLVAAGSFDGQPRFIPLAADLRVSVWSVRGFQEQGLVPPGTWKHLEETARAFYATAGSPEIGLCCGTERDIACDIIELARSAGGSPLAPDSTGLRETFAFLEWISPYILHADTDDRRAPTNREKAPQCGLLGDGTIHLARCWISEATSLAAGPPAREVRVYAGYRGPVSAANLLDGRWLALPPHGGQMKTTLRLIGFLTSLESQRILASNSVLLPARRDAYPALQRPIPALTETVKRLLAHADPPPRVVDWPCYRRVLAEAAREVLIEGRPAGEVLHKHMPQLESLITPHRR